MHKEKYYIPDNMKNYGYGEKGPDGNYYSISDKYRNQIKVYFSEKVLSSTDLE